MYVVLAVIIAMVGAVMLAKPEAFYRVTQSWKSDTAGAPSDLYILSARIGGGFFLVVGIIGAVALALLS